MKLFFTHLILFFSLLFSFSSLQADDLCYTNIDKKSFFAILPKMIIPIKNISGETLDDVHFYVDEDGFSFSFANNCDTDPETGECSQKSDIDVGPFGLLSNTTEYNLQDMASNAIVEARTQSLFDFDFFSSMNLYATYEKDGLDRKIKLSKCSDTAITDPITRPDPEYEACGVFPSALNTWGIITTGNGDLVINADTIYADGTDGKKDVTCQLDGAETTCNVYEMPIDPPTLPIDINSTLTNTINISGNLYETQYPKLNIVGDTKFQATQSYSTTESKYMSISAITGTSNDVTLTFTQGDYYFGSWTNNAKLVIRTEGKVRFFIAGNMILNNNHLDFNYNGEAGVPSDMYIFIGGNFQMTSSGGGSGYDMTAYVFAEGVFNAGTNTNNSSFKGGISAVGDITLNNNQTYTYDDDGLTEDGFGVCAGSVGLAPTGSFNVVQTSFNTTGIDPIDPAAVENRLPTQVSGRDFTVRILSLDNTNYTSLIPYNDDINIAIIYTPAYTGDQATDTALCADASPIAGTQKTVAFGGASYKDPLITNTSKALKNASFQIAYNLVNDPQYACSRDVFAIRPDKLVLSSTTQDIELLRSGVNYNLSLVATQDTSTSPTLGYTINNAQSLFTNLDTNKTIYDPAGNNVTSTLNGTLSFSATNFNILNGAADNVIGINFDDVGIVNISLVDTVWSQVDMNNNDTVADCSTNGAYICGDINATFIPHHFTLTNAHLKNFNGSTYTYISNDLNISAGFDLTITAENLGNIATQNFTNGSWENPVDVSITLPVVAQTEDKNEITTTQNLGFAAGAKTINATDSNLSANLIFNYNRSLSLPINPFTIDGSATTLNASSLYVSTSGTTATITGISNPDENATFIYGRTNAPRQRFTGDEGTALIYYEAYCSGVTCDKTLLPDGPGSTSINDPRWFSNSSHIATSGNVGVVTQKSASSISSATSTGIAIVSTVLTYNDADTKGYPYKATMENNASLWLIYNQYKPGVDTNEFEVEFTNTDAKWAGARETNTTTNINSSSKTNRRTMW